MRRTRVLALTTVAAALLTAAFTAGSTLLPGREADWVINIGLLSAAIACAFACIYAARSRHRSDGLAWTLLALALLLWATAALGNIAYTVTGQSADRWSLMIGSVVAAGTLCALAAMFSFTATYVSRNLQVVGLIDSVIVALSCFGAAWLAFLHPVRGSHGFTFGPATMFMLTAGGDFALVALGLILAKRASHPGGTVFAWVLGGAVALTITDTAVAYMSAHGGLNSLSGVWSARFAAYALFGLGAIRSRPAPKLALARATLPNDFEVLFPYPVLVLSTGFSVINAVATGDVSNFVFGMGVVILALLIIRHIITVMQNLSMLRVLDAEAEVLQGYFAHESLIPSSPLDRSQTTPSLGSFLIKGVPISRTR
jgi:hypothetical protein